MIDGEVKALSKERLMGTFVRHSWALEWWIKDNPHSTGFSSIRSKSCHSRHCVERITFFQLQRCTKAASHAVSTELSSRVGWKLYPCFQKS